MLTTTIRKCNRLNFDYIYNVTSFHKLKKMKGTIIKAIKVCTWKR